MIQKDFPFACDLFSCFSALGHYLRDIPGPRSPFSAYESFGWPLKASARPDDVSISQRASMTVSNATMRLEGMDLLYDLILKCFYGRAPRQLDVL